MFENWEGEFAKERTEPALFSIWEGYFYKALASHIFPVLETRLKHFGNIKGEDFFVKTFYPSLLKSHDEFSHFCHADDKITCVDLLETTLL